jgi:TonB family protein
MTPGQWLLDATVRSSVVLAGALIAVLLLRRRSAALRHWVLAGSLVCAAAAPLVAFALPASWRLPLDRVPIVRAVASPDPAPGVTPSHEIGRAGTTPKIPAGQQRRLPAAALAGIVWLTGALAGLTMLVAGLARLAWITSRSRPADDPRWIRSAEEISREYGLRRVPVVLQSDRAALPVTWGSARSVVIVPHAAHGWDEERIRVVLGHELAHVHRGDWLTQIAAEVVRALYWFNPLAGIASRRLRLESEQASDDLVLGLGIDPPTYARHLVDLARSLAPGHRTWLPAPAIVRPSSLERRVAAMLNSRRDRTQATRTARLIVAMLLSAAALTVAAAQGTFSTLSGSVVDPQNGLLPDVKLVLTSLQSGAKYEIRTDSSGRFEFVGLPPGSYSLEAALPGFATMRGSVDVSGQNVQRDIALKIGSLQETITVRAGAPGGVPAPGSARAKPAARPCGGGPPAPGAIGGNIRAPMKLLDVRPIFPPDLAAAHTSGEVVLEARIGADGLVHDVRTISATNPEFDSAAQAAVRQWEFSETLLNCTAVDVTMRVNVKFEG